jgi:tubulin polyglutamylase TTLL5
LYEGLNEYQKINHFPQSYELTRKDRIALNVRRMQQKFSKEEFDFIPETFVIPDEYSDFCT